MKYVFPHRSFPTTRLRRLRQHEFLRSLVCETHLSVHDLIFPVFVCSGSGVIQPIEKMPDVYRYSPDRLLFHLEEAVRLGISIIQIFPCVDSFLKDEKGSQAFCHDDVICQAIDLIKKTFPHLGVMTDVALDPYTSTGQDGVVDEKGHVLNDETNFLLAKQALIHVSAGADMISPSDMMDGRVGVIRRRLEEEGFFNVPIVVHAAKYASSLYFPFRDAVRSASHLGVSDKKSYQLNPANVDEALTEVSLDLSEGADVILIKPGLPYLDVLHQVKKTFGVPVFSYQVSGEYGMIKSAAKEGYLNERDTVLELLLSFKRAGADAVLTYYALDAARWLSEEKH